MPKPQRFCAFCGGSNLSKEHLFPDWLKVLFPRNESTKHTIGIIVPSSIHGIPRIDERRRQGHAGTVKVPGVVCARCNNGWMSQLEQRTKPILLPLIQAESGGIPPEVQRVLAAWAAKTSMVAELARPREFGVTKAERDHLKLKLEPPPHWGVWMAAYEGGKWAELGLGQNRGRLQASPIRNPKVDSSYIHATVMGLGHLVLLIIGSNWKGSPEIFSRLDGHRGVLQIWPAKPRSLLWPPPTQGGCEALTDAQVNSLANILSKGGVFNQTLNPLANWTMTM